MNQNLFSVTGDKVSSMIIDKEAIKFSSKNLTSFDDFQEDWQKKLSVAKKHEIKLDKIKFISREENNNEVVITYASLWGLFTFSKTWDYPFSFKNDEDVERFFSYFSQNHSYYRINEKPTPLQAIKDNIFYLLFTIGITVLGYTTGLEIEQGDAPGNHSGKAFIFYKIVKFLGSNGVMVTGVLASSFIAFKMWKRYINPPNKIKIIAPNKW